MDPETLSRLTSLAEKGGLPEGTALVDLLAEGVDQLMFLKGDKVAVLECLDLEKGVYLGYCEGVLGKFDRAHFSFEPEVVLPSPSPQPSSSSSPSSTNPPLLSSSTEDEEAITTASPSSPPSTTTDLTPTHIELEEEQPLIPTESASPSSPEESPPSSSSPPSPPELPLPVPRRRPLTSTFNRGGGDISNGSSEDLELEAEKKRRRRNDPGAFMDFESFVVPSGLAGEQKLEVEEVEEKVEAEEVVDLSKETQEEEEEEQEEHGRSSRELNINIPPVDSTFEFDDGTLSRTPSTSASPSTSGLSTLPPSPAVNQQLGSRSSSPRPESTLGSHIGHDQRASSILDAAVLFPLPPTHETSPPPSDEPGLPTPPQSLEFHTLFPSEPSNSNPNRPLHDRNSYPRNASHPNELPSSATFPSPNPSPRRASTNSPLVVSPSPSPVKQLKSPSSRSLATKLASSFSSSTLATSSSHREEDGEEEWDIFADYARASMYEPDFSLEAGSGSDSTKKAARMSKRMSRLPSSLSQEFSAPIPSLPPPLAAPSSPPKYPRSLQSSVWNPHRPETLVLESTTPTKEAGPVRTSVSMPISPSTPTHSFPDSPATLVGASVMNLASPTTPPSPTIGLAPESPEVNPLEELRAKSPSGGLGLASNLREIIQEKNQALSRRGSEEEEGISQALGKTMVVEEEETSSEKKEEATVEKDASVELSQDSAVGVEEDSLATPQLPSVAVLATSPVLSSMEESTPRIGSISDASKEPDFVTPSPSTRSLKPSLTLTIDTNLPKPTSSSSSEPPSDQPSVERSSSAASRTESLPSPGAFHGRTDFDLSSSPGPVPISFFVSNQNQLNGSPRQHPFTSISPPLSPTSSSVGLGLGIPSVSSGPSSSGHSSVETAQGGGWERSRSPPGAGEFGVSGEAGAGSFGRGSLSSLRGGAQPRPGFFPKERPRSRSFSSFSGQTVELGYPLYTPSSPGSPNSHQSSFVSLSSSPHFLPSTSGGFRGHRPALQSSLAIVSGGRYPLDQPQPPPPIRPDTFGRRNSDRPRVQSPSSPLVPSQLSAQSSFPSRKSKDAPSPKTRGVEFPSSSRQQAPSPKGFFSSAPSPTPPISVVEPPTPKRGGFLNMFRSRSASMVGSRSSVPVMAALAPPVPLLPTTAPIPPPSPIQVKSESPISPAATPFGPPATTQSPTNPPLPSPGRRAPSPAASSPIELPSSNLLSPVTPETPSSPFSASPTHRSSPPRRVSTSTTASLQTGLSRQSSADATSIDLNPPTMGQGRSSTSLSSSLKSPKSMTKLRKSAGLSPSKRTVPLPPAVSSRDFQEEMVQEGGFEFELLKPLARKASLERRSSMDPLSSPVVDELHPPNDVVARRSASGPAGTPTPKPLPETDEYGFFLRPGRKSMKKQDGPTADEFRLLEQKWLGIISSSTLASVQKNKKNKKLVRSGLPASLRGRIWAFLLESQTQRRQGLFDQLCVVSPATSEMEEAASRAFSDHEQFNEPNSGRHDLLAVLRSYAQLNQPLGLQYGMGQIAGTLLMAAPAEDAFWLFASVVDSIRNLYKKDLAVESLVFVYLLESLDKPLAKRIIVDCKIDPEMIISQWLQPMFVRTLPFATVLRIWDVSFFEGPSYLLRVALAIVLSAKGRLMDQKAMTSVEHIKLYLLTPPHDHLLSADTLIPIADGLKISTKEEDLRKLRSKAMMALEEGRAAIRAARRAAGLATTPTTPGGSNYKR